MNPARVVSVHFPKAAGSSLHFQLSKLLGDKVALDYTHDPLTSAGKETAEFPSGKRFVHGHFRAQTIRIHRRILDDFLASPGRQSNLDLFFLESFTGTGPRASRAISPRPTLDPEVCDVSRHKLSLMAETYFGNFDMSRFDFIGFYENRDADVPRLAKVLGLPLEAGLHENRTAETVERLELEADISIRRQLNDLLAADVAFYERLRR
jgi:hypothetical protein